MTLGFLPRALMLPISAVEKASYVVVPCGNYPVSFCVSPQERMPQTPPFAAVFDSSGYNRNLYQSEEDNSGGLCYHDNNLLSGSLGALIQHLVPSVDCYPDVSLYPQLAVWLGLTRLVKRNFTCTAKAERVTSNCQGRGSSD